MPIGTVFHPRTLALCESLNYREWSGYYAVSAYETQHEHEYHAIRHAAALIDVSPLFKYRVSGPDASRLVDRIITRDVRKMTAGQVWYTPWCDDEGKVIDDGTVTRLDEQTFRWTAADPSLRWFRQNAAGLDVHIEDISEQVVALALQGPTSGRVLRAVREEENSTAMSGKNVFAFKVQALIVGAMVIFSESTALQFYGIALTGLGLLTTTGFILAMDTYGPITDNAHGIFEMGGVHQEEASRTLSWMDAIGNTTKALTKGLAIATAVLAAVSLFRSFIDEAHLSAIGVQINTPTVFIGLLIGGAVPFLFSAFAIKAVSRAAYQVVFEVRRQFREHPGIMEYKEKPDYGRCVDIVTATAQKELLGPGILAVFGPLLIGFGLGAGALGGFLGGAILTGQLLAVFMANAGANWDNAKKKIEDGFLGGKGTDVHKAAVVGDTVGDPFKDTAGPALNPMIKVMNLVGILAAPFTISAGATTSAVVVIISIAALAIAVAFSKRGSIAEEEAAGGTGKLAA